MSEHRRKSPQPQPPAGGRAAARRAAQQPMGRRSQARDVSMGSPSSPYGDEAPYGGRAAARRAAQQRGGRRAAGGGAGGHGGGGRRGGGGGGYDGGRGRGGGRPPGRKRMIDYPRYGKYGWRRWVPSWKLVSGLTLGFLGLLMGGATIAYSMVVVPNEDDGAKAQNNVYYWSDGTQMAATGGEVNRQILAYDAIPKAMQDAVVSAENKTFWTDSGIDPMGIGRAVFNMARGGQTQGGSTITQQYVKNNRLADQSQTLSRKVKELFISMKVGNTYKKPEIMAGYLNTAYYGRGAYGLQAAARAYYNRDASQLTVSECAFLASVLKGATYYDPAGAPEIDTEASPEKNTARAVKRWKWILDEMVKDGSLPAAERAKFPEFPMPVLPKKDAALSGQKGYLVSLAKAYFLNNNDQGITEEQLSRGGYEIYTTFDKDKVTALEESVKKIRQEYIDPQKRPKYDTHVQFGGASVDPASGAIVAIYGGEDATKHFTNNADQTGAMVGSTWKPFVLAAAMNDGVRDPKDPSIRRKVDPDKSRYDAKHNLVVKNYDGTIWHDENGKEWKQANEGDRSYGPISLRRAMVKSANSPFVQLGMDVGIDKVREAAKNAGLKDDNSMVKGEVPSFSLGISHPSAIRMAGSYATFAANGEQREPFSVKEAKKAGKIVFKHEVKTKQGFTTAVASNITDVLRSVVEDPEGTGTKAAIPGRQVAGKTGTTDDNMSAWFVGYTPQLSTAIDMYRLDDNEKNTKREFLPMYNTGGQQTIHGSSFPSRIWKDYMTKALKGQPVKTFPEPEDLPDAEAVYGGGAASPTPTPTNSPSGTPSDMPSTLPSQRPSDRPKPGKTCDMLDWDCEPTGGQDGGTTDGGTTDGGTTDGGTTDGGTGGLPSPTETAGNGGNGNGGKTDGGGGFFGGVDG
ncbi:transglycosylase domain-containing protein [Streptomyces tritici]|uniref:transglycosylase domain-containing protein n=1 Tax=Streptomyces tritici TaxID=2054410 RepID=UPI003AEF59FE